MERLRGLTTLIAASLTLLQSVSMAGSLTFDSRARWIWTGETEKPVDVYRVFRKTFSLGSKPRKAILRITADAEYRLFVNGDYVARGPAPNPPAHISVDEIDIATKLKSGKNCIGVIVYHLGAPSFPRMLGQPGLLAQLDASGDSVVTDDSWRWRDAWWTPSGQRYTGFREFTEILDAHKEPRGWTTAKFDDSGWKQAAPVGPVGIAPWSNPESRDIPMPEHHVSHAANLLFAGHSARTDFSPKEASQLLAQSPEQAGDATVIAPGFLGSGSGRIDGSARTVTVGIDFGREVSGFPEITATAEADGVILDLGYGEGLEKDGHVSVRRQGNPSCDRLILRKGKQTLRIFHHRAFRYMVLAVHGGAARIEAPRVIESGYPVKPRGSFSCSDPRLTRIWEVGARTMQICMDQGFMDCPWRERGQYIGDGLAEGPVALYAFGDTALMRRFLRQGSLCQPADGMLEPAYPSDWTIWHGSRGPNRIPGYGALWVVMLEQYWLATGDNDLVRELIPTTGRLMAWFNPYRDSRGMLKDVPEWNFIDWASMNPDSATACLSLQYLMALRSADILDPSRTDRGKADRLAGAFESAHWDEPRGLYRDAANLYTVHTNVLALLTVVNGPARAKRIIEHLSDPDLLKPESPYFEGFTLRALCKFGRHDLALKIIRDKWGHMVDEGATTFWESYAAQWSLCHAWSCTPTALLSEEVLGASYDATTKRIRIAPHTVGLKWAKGRAPLFCGNVDVAWRQKDGEFVIDISVPHGVTVDLDLPATAESRVAVNGEETTFFAFQNGRASARIDSGDGKWSITVKNR